MRRTSLVVSVLLAATLGVDPIGASQDLIDQLMLGRQPPPPAGTGFVAGRVVEVGSNRPIPGAIVTPTIMTTKVAGQYEAVLTDDQGRFVLRDLAAGQFTMSVTKAGYVDGVYGRLGRDEQSYSGERLTLADGEHASGITIALQKFATISGVVLDEHGEPVVGAGVRAVGKTMSGGRSRFSIEYQSSFTATTDDRGMFRISTLPPGDYVVALPSVVTSWPKSLVRFSAAGGRGETFSTSRWLVSQGGGGSGGGTDVGDDQFVLTGLGGLGGRGGGPPSLAGITAEGRLLVYETQFYPGATLLSRATVIALASGDERNGIDFRMKPVTGTRVSGVITGPDGPVRDFKLRLVHAEMAEMTTDPEVAQTATDVDGRFAFLVVPPGQYVVRGVRLPPRGPVQQISNDAGTVVGAAGRSGSSVFIVGGPSTLPEEPIWLVDLPVSVGSTDVNDLAATLRRGSRIGGRLQYEGAAARPSFALGGSVQIQRADGTASIEYGLQSAPIEQSGKVRSGGNLPGQYFVRPEPVLGAWHLKSVMSGGRDVSLVPIDLSSSDIDDVVVTYVDRAITRLGGTVTTDRGQPAESGSVILFPQDRAHWANNGTRPRDLRAAGVTRGGQFSIEDLPPGEYFAAAIGDAKTAWNSPETLTRLATGATRVTLADGDSKTIALKMVATPREPLETDSVCGGCAGDVEVSAGPLSPEPMKLWKTGTTPLPQRGGAITRDQTPPAPVGTAVISGVILSDEKTPQPIKRAYVSLSGTALMGSRAAITDENGRFSFTGLPAARVALSASKPAYLAANYGATIVLTDGQRMTDIKLTMIKGGVVTGTIRDERGQLQQSAQVRLMRYSMTGGERRLVSVSASGASQTDDRGMFRLYGISPGEYMVTATPPQGSGSARLTTAADLQAAARTGPASPGASTAAAPAASSTGSYAGVFYPGVVRPDQARAVKITAGGELTGIDFSLQFVRTATVSGAVIAAGGAMPPNMEIRITSLTESAPGVTDFLSMLPMRPRADGTFEFSGVAPGTWVVTAYVVPPAAGRGPEAGFNGNGWWASSEIEMNGADIKGVSLSLQPGLSLTGRVTTRATTLSSPSIAGVNVSLRPVLTGTQITMGRLSTMTTPDGSFVFQGLLPGRYRVTASSAALPVIGTTWLLESAMANGVDVSETPFDLKSTGQNPAIVVTFSDQPAEISGVLQTAAGRPTSEYYVIVFPVERNLQTNATRRIQQVRPATDGRFTFRGLRSGDYIIAALTELDPAELFDPAFLEQVAPAGVKITLAPGEKKTQDLKIGG